MTVSGEVTGEVGGRNHFIDFDLDSTEFSDNFEENPAFVYVEFTSGAKEGGCLVKLVVDAALCCGHGQCAALAPDVYSLDDDGLTADVGRTVDVAEGEEAAARTVRTATSTGRHDPHWAGIPAVWVSTARSGSGWRPTVQSVTSTSLPSLRAATWWTGSGGSSFSATGPADCITICVSSWTALW